MPWLNYSDEEVSRYHPVFLDSANKALSEEGMDGKYIWQHHLRTPGNTLIPDFVLIEKSSNRWILAVEVKRSKEHVFSIRCQGQAKLYAESAQNNYHPNQPKYFAITNLEHIILFAMRGADPPDRCRIQDGYQTVGSFSNDTEAVFKSRLTTATRKILRQVTSAHPAIFDVVWPGILRDFVSCADALTGHGLISEPTSKNWKVVREYFCNPVDVDSARVLLFGCLLSEYAAGILDRFSHPKRRQLSPLRPSDATNIGASVANALDRLRTIDFCQIIDDATITWYRTAKPNPVGKHLSAYVSKLVRHPDSVINLARQRLDQAELIDGLIVAEHGNTQLDDCGKVRTDAELASLLAYAAISAPNEIVIDPCCGDGSLLDAAYSRLSELSTRYPAILSQIHGVEVDPLLARFATLRILLREPAALTSQDQVQIAQGDMFARPEAIAKADVILMNPPFRRYEAQDQNPVPPELKTHYAHEIKKLTRRDSISLTGQQNFYSYYVEFVISAAKEGARIALILDNKWYQNLHAGPLKQFLLNTCEIETIIEYPYANLFADWAIATSVVICRKTKSISKAHDVKFIRCLLELSQVDFHEFSSKILTGGDIPLGWNRRTVKQSALKHNEGWKRHFGSPLRHDFRTLLPILSSLFSHSRRGSLAKEEGGMGPLAFPFSRKSFGYLRTSSQTPGSRRFKTKRSRALTPAENKHLHKLAASIPADFQGLAVENSDTLTAYTLNADQLSIQPTIEPPALRGHNIFWNEKKTRWTEHHERALSELHASTPVTEFVKDFRKATGLSPAVNLLHPLETSLKT